MWKIKHFFDGEYGCEALLPGEKPKILVTLENGEGKRKTVEVTEDWLTERRLREGDFWPEDTPLL